MKKLSELFKSERFINILSWVFVIALGIGIIVLLENLNVSKSAKYGIGKGIKWLLIFVPWLGLKIYNLFTKQEKTADATEAEEKAMETEQEENRPVQAPMPSPAKEEAPRYEKPIDLPLEKPKESTWSIVVTAIIVAAIILVGSYFLLHGKVF